MIPTAPKDEYRIKPVYIVLPIVVLVVLAWGGVKLWERHKHKELMEFYRTEVERFGDKKFQELRSKGFDHYLEYWEENADFVDDGKLSYPYSDDFLVIDFTGPFRVGQPVTEVAWQVELKPVTGPPNQFELKLFIVHERANYIKTYTGSLTEE